MEIGHTIPGILVTFPHALRVRMNQQQAVMAMGNTVQEVIEALNQSYPGIRFNLCDETGELRPYVNVFLNGKNIRYLQGLTTSVASGSTIHILQSVAGG